MLDFGDFRLGGGEPIYLQILLYIKRGAAAGAVRDGDELPSRRVLSALLGVNPNTIQKAYRILEEEGLVSSRTGAKSCMLLSEETVQRIREELLERDVKSVVDAMRQTGVSKEQALDLIEKCWEGRI